MTDRVSEILSADVRDAILAPIEQARTLPRQAFTCTEFARAEAERVFAGNWSALYFTELVPGCGDVQPVELAGIPLVIVRGEDDVLRVFHNVVPYDGCMAVLQPATGLAEITAPYHGWRYDLAGKLTSIPYWGGEVSGEDLSPVGERPKDLIEVPSGTWGPVLFVNIDGDAGPFADALAPLDRALADWDTQALFVARDSSGSPILHPEDLLTNWKTHLENWGINVLHEAFVHEIYEQSPEVPRMREDGVKTCEDHIDGHFMALKYLEADFRNTYGELPFPPLGRNPESPPRYGYFGTLLPNLHVGVFSNLIHLIISNPVGAARTETVRAQFYHPDAATDPALLEAREMLALGLVAAGQEDAVITQAVQRARQSPAFDSQYYSKHWDEMHYRFSQWVLKEMLGT